MVQFLEFEPENWYVPVGLPAADPDSRIQTRRDHPEKLLATPEGARTMRGKARCVRFSEPVHRRRTAMGACAHQPV